MFLLYFLNGYSYLKFFCRFQFHALMATNFKNLMKNKSNLLKIRKNKISYILVTSGGKNHAKTFYFFFKFEESLVKV